MNSVSSGCHEHSCGEDESVGSGGCRRLNPGDRIGVGFNFPPIAM